MPAYGTYSLQDLLATTSQTAAMFGEETIWATFRAYLDAHNRQMVEMVQEFVFFTTERLHGSGGVQTGEFEELSEFTTPRPQKVTAGQNLVIPLRMYGFGRQWTELYMDEATPADLAAQFVSVMDADKRNIINQINRAIYGATNYTFVDIRRKDNVSLPIKRLANADGWALETGPNGETFDGATHTHYLARAGGAWAASDLDRLITAAQEHYIGNVRVSINAAQESAVRAFSGFTPVTDTRIVQANSTTYTAGALDTTNPGNRLIGIYNGAEIYVKSWELASYARSWNTGAPKVLGFRTRNPIGDGTAAGIGGLRPLYTQRGYPLMMDGWGREFGVATINRLGMAVMYTGGTSYVTPTIADAA